MKTLIIELLALVTTATGASAATKTYKKDLKASVNFYAGTVSEVTRALNNKLIAKAVKTCGSKNQISHLTEYEVHVDLNHFGADSNEIIFFNFDAEPHKPLNPFSVYYPAGDITATVVCLK